MVAPPTLTMAKSPTTAQAPGRAAPIIRQRIEAGGERLWRMEDFRDLPFTAVAQAFSRLVKAGVLERISKGVYYRPRQTALGKSRPTPAALHGCLQPRLNVFPAGLAAANLLGFSTQTAARAELATSALSLPRKLVGMDAVIHTRRPEAWAGLSDRDAALLDFLRRGGQYSELSPQETTRKVLSLIDAPGCFERLLIVAPTEPPRVRAILGAIGEHLGRAPRILRELRASLNPFSKFNFGMLSALPNASAWQAREPLDETL